MAHIYGCIVLFLLAACVNADDIDVRARKGVMTKFLRELVNQTKADTLNLPANSTSIRENITDTFSCENRTYGYYADVDNECQVFHVCLTSQAASGRNTTYRWSFICPNETVFNQEVLTCTRPRDSIDCEQSPMFYHLNDDIGKVDNNTEPSSDGQKTENPTTSAKRNKPQKRKQNIIAQSLMKEAIKENYLQMEVDLNKNEMDDVEGMPEMMEDGRPVKPQIHDVDEEYVMNSNIERSRLAAERSFKRRSRKLRGYVKYNDAV